MIPWERSDSEDWVHLLGRTDDDEWDDDDQDLDEDFEDDDDDDDEDFEDYEDDEDDEEDDFEEDQDDWYRRRRDERSYYSDDEWN